MQQRVQPIPRSSPVSLARWLYYLASFPTLFFGIQNRREMLGAFFSRERTRPFTIRLRPDGMRFEVRGAMDIWIIKETCLDREYERAGVPLEDGWTIIDIGAGLGDFTVYAAKDRPRSRVFAYEPFPGSFTLLETNIKANGLQNVRIFPLAVGARAGPMTLDVSATDAVLFSTARTSEGRARKSLTVMGTTLDQLFDGLRLDRCDFMKIDCEGGEFDVLFHASRRTLERIDRVCLEYHDGFTAYNHSELATFLAARGFSVELHPNKIDRRLGLLYASRLSRKSR